MQAACRQMASHEPPPADEQDDPRDAIVQRLLPATTTERPPTTRGVRSVFELGIRPTAGLQLAPGLAQGTAGPAPRISKVQRDTGALRVVGGRYPDNRWSAERELEEIARRAKQRPPRPTKGFRTRGKKVRAWDGEGGLAD